MQDGDKNEVISLFTCFAPCDLLQDEMANAGSKVVMSLFLSPGGPKFVSLMLYLATHVMQLDMKTFVTGRAFGELYH